MVRMWTSFLLLLLFLVNTCTSSTPDLLQISPAGHALVQLIDSLHVEEKWNKGVHVAWFSGEANNQFAKYGVSTHCSAFASSVAERFGVPLLRPPNHGQVLLASPQHRWLVGAGKELGWSLTNDLLQLQYAANQGKLAIISKESLQISSPGHIAFVRPLAVTDTAFLLKNGPQVAQSGIVNSANITASKAFRPLFARNVIYAIYDPARAPLASLPATLWMLPSQPTTTKTTLVYAVDLAQSGRLDVIRIFYSSKGNPTWACASGGIGVANSSAWMPWFSYSLPRAGSAPPTGEPFLTNKVGWSVFGLSTSISGKQELNLMNQDGVVGNVPPVALTPDMRSSPVPGITGLWYAALDGQFYGIFITKSTTIGVFGYVLKYSESGGSLWETLSANWTSDGGTDASSTNSATGTSGYNTIHRSARGYTEKCTIPSAKVKAAGMKIAKTTTTAVQCSKTASAVDLIIDGMTAKISGLSINSNLNTTVYIIEKATPYYKD